MDEVVEEEEGGDVMPLLELVPVREEGPVQEESAGLAVVPPQRRSSRLSGVAPQPGLEFATIRRSRK